jgi:hypothetical protein
MPSSPAALFVTIVLLAGSRVVTPVQGKASILGLVAEDATFDDFTKAFGPTEISHCGGSHAEGCGAWACWVGPDGTTLLAGADDMEGEENVVKHIHLLVRRDLADFDGEFGRPGRAAPPRCAATRKLTRTVATGVGVRLGMLRAEVLEAFKHQAVGTDSALARAGKAAFIRVPDEDRVERDGKGCRIGAPALDLVLDVERERVVGIRMYYSSVM